VARRFEHLQHFQGNRYQRLGMQPNCADGSELVDFYLELIHP
jgi:hypothetical protein